MTSVRRWGWIALTLTIGCQSDLDPSALEGVTGAWTSSDAAFTLWIMPSGATRILGTPEPGQGHVVRSARANRYLIHGRAADGQDPMVLVLTAPDTMWVKKPRADGGLRLSPEETQLVRMSEQAFDAVLRGWNAQKAAAQRLRP